jgi:branched-chain amino acid transport system permease protein
MSLSSLSPYIINLLILIAIYIILATSLNLALGYTGLLNLGHVAFFGIGAYTSALLMMNLQVPYIFAMIIGGLIASIFGFILVWATGRLKGDYLAMATLGFAFVSVSLFKSLDFLTRGVRGLPGIPKPEIFGLVINTKIEFLIFYWIVAIICVLIIARTVKSDFGRLLQATRDDEIGLRVLGKNTFLLKAKAMMISAFFAGIGGSLFAHYISFIEPKSFVLPEIILLLTIVIIGGIASTRGAIVGSFVILLIPEVLRLFSLPPGILGPGRQIIYALILLGVILYKPRGLFGKVDLE